MDANDVACLRATVSKLSRRLRNEGSRAGGLSAGALAVLGRVRRDGPLAAKDLARLEHLQPPSVTRIVDRLSTLGLVDRTAHPTDGRACLVAMTDAGHRFSDETLDQRTAWLATRLDLLTADELAAIEAALPALARLAEQP